jgi:peptidoglycan L-alanyl-D-glutamate endopeptidase CwlK
MNRDGDNDCTADWLEVVQQAKAIGFEWGGDWTSFKDYPHFQLSFGMTLAALRTGAKPAASAVAAVYERIKLKEEQTVKSEITASVKVNGVKIAEGIMESGITYAPVRVIAEALGAQVGYNPATKTVDITSSHQKGANS